MGKVSISRFTENFIEQRGGGDVEAVLIIAVDGQNVTASCIGPDPLLINDKSVALVGAMRTLLDEKFKLANTMYSHLKQQGRIRTELQEQVFDVASEAFEAVKPEEQPKPEWRSKANPDPKVEFFHGLFDLLERTFGGGTNAHDD